MEVTEASLRDGLYDSYRETIGKIESETDELKRKNLYFDLIVLISGFLYNLLQVPFNNKIINVDTSLIMAGNLYIFLQYLKRLKNEKGDHAAKFASFELKGPTSIKPTALSVVSLFVEFDKVLPGSYQKIDFQILMPLAVVMTNLKSALAEVRMGVNTVPYGMIPKGITISRKRNADRRRVTVPLSALGLGIQHSPLLHGLTFPHEKKTVMLKGLGPLTLAIMLAAQPKHSDKIRKAFVENLSHLEMADKVADALLLNKDNWSGLLRSLGDMLIINSNKGARRFYFPLEVYMALYVEMGSNGLNGTFSFNGEKMIEHYIRSLSYTWKMRGDESQSDCLRQYLFHGMFTGGFENLGILKMITNFPSWRNRSSLSNGLQKRFEKFLIDIVPIGFTYFSKGSRALPVGRMMPMYTGDFRFAGQRTRAFSAELRNYLQSGTHIAYSNDIPSLISALNALKLETKKLLDNSEMKKAVTAYWFKVGAGGSLSFTEDKDFLPVEDPYGYFYV